MGGKTGYLEDGRDKDRVCVGETEKGGVALGLELGGCADHGWVKGHGREGVFDLLSCDAACMDLLEGLGTWGREGEQWRRPGCLHEICPLDVLCSLVATADVWGKDLEDIAVSVLVCEGPVKVKDEELLHGGKTERGRG